MKLGKDFVFWAKMILALIRALLQFAAKDNEDSPGDGKEIV